MPVTMLDPRVEADLRTAPLSYDEVGRTRAVMPPGYRLLSRMRVLDEDTTWQQARSGLLARQVPERAGLRVQVSATRIVQDAVGVLSLGVGALTVRAPVRVVYLVDTADRCAFGYGTLPGHPESGEEAFILDRAPDGRILFTITAFSRPATRLARFAGPVGRAVQTAMTLRYLRSL